MYILAIYNNQLFFYKSTNVLVLASLKLIQITLFIAFDLGEFQNDRSRWIVDYGRHYEVERIRCLFAGFNFELFKNVNQQQFGFIICKVQAQAGFLADSKGEKLTWMMFGSGEERIKRLITIYHFVNSV